MNWDDEKLFYLMAEQLKKVANYYIDHPKVTLCRMLDLHIENVNYSGRIERWCGAGVSLKSYDIDGNCYPCQLFQPLSVEGNYVLEDINNIINQSNTFDEYCSDCSIYNICPTCYGHNYAATGDISKRDRGLCNLTKLNALVSSYIWLKKMELYSQNELGLSDESYRMIFDAARLIQETLPLGM